MNPQINRFLKEKEEEHSTQHSATYTFSSDSKALFEDFLTTDAMGEDYFETSEDTEQMKISEENSRWIFENIPEYFNVIKKEGKIVGYSFLMPSTKNIMENFVSGMINEAELFDGIKKMDSEFLVRPEAVYLCSFYVDENNRRRGLASIAGIKTISSIASRFNITPTLFAWRYSDEGRLLCRKIAKVMGFDLKFRKEQL